MLDADVNMACDVLLFKIDVRAGYWGMYNFYKMQVYWHLQAVCIEAPLQLLHNVHICIISYEYWR